MIILKYFALVHVTYSSAIHEMTLQDGAFNVEKVDRDGDITAHVFLTPCSSVVMKDINLTLTLNRYASPVNIEK